MNKLKSAEEIQYMIALNVESGFPLANIKFGHFEAVTELMAKSIVRCEEKFRCTLNTEQTVAAARHVAEAVLTFTDPRLTTIYIDYCNRADPVFRGNYDHRNSSEETVRHDGYSYRVSHVQRLISENEDAQASLEEINSLDSEIPSWLMANCMVRYEELKRKEFDDLEIGYLAASVLDAILTLSYPVTKAIFEDYRRHATPELGGHYQAEARTPDINASAMPTPKGRFGPSALFLTLLLRLRNRFR